MKKSKRRMAHLQPTTTSRRPVRVAALVGIGVIATALVGLTWRSRPAAPATAPESAGAARTAASAAPAPPSVTAAGTPAHYRPLVGEWLRPDGGYVLSVAGVAADGRAAATYTNPRPIRVAQAEARREGDLVGLFVKLDDIGYPGSTYRLGYDAASGQLRGIYYQAARGQQYEVVFVRQR